MITGQFFSHLRSWISSDSYQEFSMTWVPKRIKQILISISIYKGETATAARKFECGVWGENLESGWGIWCLKKKCGFSVEQSSPNRN